MTKLHEVYKCNICGNIAVMVHSGQGEMVCCGQPMQLLTENTVDASYEKHVPFIEVDGSTVKVRVGSVSHPMEEKHYIEWIEIIAGDRSYRAFLKPGDLPKATFVGIEDKEFTAREYCNLHGLWRADYKRE